MSTRSASLVSIITEIEDLEGNGSVTLGEVVRLIGQVSFAPLLIVPAIALVSPLSGIPLFSTIMGLIIFLVSIQMLFRRDHLWLPNWLLHLTARRSRVRSAFEKLHPLVAWLDKRTHKRLTALTHRPLIFIPQTACVLSGMCLPLLEVVPFSSSMVGLAVALMGIGIFVRDGVVLMIAMVPYAIIAVLVTRLI
ncbi:exopolysaccharide biosynthesis protein [Sulfitobacter sp.]|uniref:exopolysaccharide biosynthesis protein n=1 Tax=Sulfitobacter sp. TaxID=1903071 RepID=UPI003EF0DA10